MKHLLKRYPKMSGESLAQWRQRLHRIASAPYHFVGIKCPASTILQIDRALTATVETH
jgi:hypothetical protein